MRPPVPALDPRTVAAPSGRGDACVGSGGRSPRPALGRPGGALYLLTGFVAGLLVFSLLLAGPVAAQTDPFDPFVDQRRDMVDHQLRDRGIDEPHILDAMATVPRHLFVPEAFERDAYDDRPVPIAPGQTLSAAVVSARMISLLEVDEDDKVLEIGTGSGYDAALLSTLADQVHTIEIDRELGREAREKLRRLGYDNVTVHIGDGYRGLPEEAPFDAILLTAAPERVPEPLFEQLAPGGRMVVAVGYSLHQDLQVITKTLDGEREVRRVSLVSLVPMTGEVTEGDGGG